MITYLTWGETPRSYGVYGSQVVGQFVKNSEAWPSVDYQFVAGIPLVHSGLLRERFSYLKQLKLINAKLAPIPFSQIWIPCLQTAVNSNEQSFYKLHSPSSHRKLAGKLNGSRIVHCRSYHAAFAAIETKKKYSLDYKIIFDARGLWPEEVAYRSAYKEDIAAFLFRKNVEVDLIANSDCVVSVSETMQELMTELGAKKSACILLSCETALASSFSSVRKKNAAGFRLTYCGALGHSTWHDPDALAALYKKFKSELGTTSLQLITTHSPSDFMSSFADLSSNELSITPALSQEEVYQNLAQGDFFALSYRNPTNFIEDRLAKGVLATKTAEYSSFRNTVLCNKVCGGASRLVDRHGLGISYSPTSFEEIERDRLIKAYQSPRQIDVINTLFSSEVHARQYVDLYKSLLQ